MSVLVLGMSHRTAPIEVLERASLDTDDGVKLSHKVLESPHITESVVISTCNRVEVYVEAERFHGAIEELSRLFADHAGLGRDELVHHLYVHYDDAAVAHLFSVAAGLDSMILGESQILGQVRLSLQSAQAESTVGPALNALFQQALRIGKRGHAETGIDRLAPSVVTAALDAANEAMAAGDPADGRQIDAETRYLVAGAGTMASLAVRTLIERGVAPERIMLTNRTYQRAAEFVATFGVGAVRWESLDLELRAADILISCTGATGVVFDRDRIAAATQDGRPITLVDLALPRDIAADVTTLPNTTLIDMQVLAERAADSEVVADVAAVRAIVDGEVGTFLAAKAASRVTPTVVALRGMAVEIVQSETDRLEARLGDLTDAQRAEIRHALRRVSDKLLHQPTVRVQQLVDGPAGLTYADALADLFALDPSAVDRVSAVGEGAE
ncbi:MAG: glutamyl-tRNA reductase [Aeromicrobium sp.]|uniref:glutamyl-tRNA reductase n=1 Tax=Aeromicrobium sp. TaxID=1871063 RepID=UPI0025B9D660|nr:glutamyl-tRNA reductase [Aeromicrobium sp.]MCK5892039.1 glutamyl-tRNA reductase [Aeromicrobium sp.]MDF1704302.1 glutamyl-tRNA reductase [Aeromicrobium sp.]